MSCTLCQKVVPFAISKVVKHGCNWIFDAEAIGICEAAGLGPEDPMSEVCAGAVIAGCSIISHEVSSHVTNANTICQKMHACWILNINKILYLWVDYFLYFYNFLIFEFLM